MSHGGYKRPRVPGVRRQYRPSPPPRLLLQPALWLAGAAAAAATAAECRETAWGPVRSGLQLMGKEVSEHVTGGTSHRGRPPGV